MKKVIKGKKLMVFIGGNGEQSTEFKSIALATNHTLTMQASTNALAVKTKDDADGKSWADSEINEMSWTVTSEHLVGVNEGEGFSDIFDLYLAGKKVWLVFDGVTADGVPTGGYSPASSTSGEGADNFQGVKGQALITNLTVNAPLEDNGSYTVEFTGCGELAKYNA